MPPGACGGGGPPPPGPPGPPGPGGGAAPASPISAFLSSAGRIDCAWSSLRPKARVPAWIIRRTARPLSDLCPYLGSASSRIRIAIWMRESAEASSPRAACGAMVGAPPGAGSPPAPIGGGGAGALAGPPGGSAAPGAGAGGVPNWSAGVDIPCRRCGAKIARDPPTLSRNPSCYPPGFLFAPPSY